MGGPSGQKIWKELLLRCIKGLMASGQLGEIICSPGWITVLLDVMSTPTSYFVVNFDPVIFSLGPWNLSGHEIFLQVRWYGLMYVLGFLCAAWVFKRMAKEGRAKLPADQVENLIVYLIVGMLLGSRTFYLLFYAEPGFVQSWVDIIAVWRGGLSFHGALTGMLLAMWLFAHRLHLHFFEITDWAAIAVTPGLFLGRIGNFINGELWGRVTDVPWAMIFPAAGPYPRHPSPLYEAALEGILLFCILWPLRKKVRWSGQLSAIFIFGYGIIRIFLECFREPDEQLGFYFEYITMGQMLSVGMLIVGIIWWMYSLKIKRPVG